MTRGPRNDTDNDLKARTTMIGSNATPGNPRETY
jgi:hypothetical protein